MSMYCQMSRGLVMVRSMLSRDHLGGGRVSLGCCYGTDLLMINSVCIFKGMDWPGEKGTDVGNWQLQC